MTCHTHRLSVPSLPDCLSWTSRCFAQQHAHDSRWWKTAMVPNINTSSGFLDIGLHRLERQRSSAKRVKPTSYPPTKHKFLQLVTLLTHKANIIMICPIENPQEPIRPVYWDSDSPPFTPVPLPLFVEINEHVRMVSDGIPGVRCAVCRDKGIETWVVPGLPCSECQTPAPAQ